MKTFVYTAITMLLPDLVLAHPGDHSHADAMHFLSSPWHVPGLVVLAVSLVVIARRGHGMGTVARKRQDHHDPR